VSGAFCAQRPPGRSGKGFLTPFSESAFANWKSRKRLSGELSAMAEWTAVRLQRGIWIDSQRLAAAGLQDALEITVELGEIRIRSAEPSAPGGADSAADIEGTYPLMDESFREGWEAPGMEDYDRYEELKKI
jgi:hypothetical protein